MKHFVQRLEEYSENPEAKATGEVPYNAPVLCTQLEGWGGGRPWFKVQDNWLVPVI